MNVLLHCTNRGDLCLTIARFPGCPDWNRVRCVRCGEPMRLEGSTLSAPLAEPTWRSFENGAWADSTPRPEQLVLL